ncbi:DUF3786 domain-containing protein [Candidatus Bipolaricaulota bacterium]|nr:DUF3786 domain-containing protein [Candidatus Bipolaricaulota bacterium]
MPKEAMRESLRPRIDAARVNLRSYDPEELVHRGGLTLSENRLEFTLLGTSYYIQLPDLVAHFADGTVCPEELQILFLDYLVHGDGTPPSGQWIGFQQLPNGMFYRKAFQGYSGDQLVHDLGEKIDAFREAAASLGGEPVELGDAAYAFRVLPNVLLAVVWWNGDEEFPANGTVLFDASTSHYLPTDGLAIVGRMLCRKLAKLGGAQ